MSGVDPDNHTGNTELKDAVEAENHKPGYTGDSYCKDCKVLLKKGNVIPTLLPDVTPSVDSTPEPEGIPEQPDDDETGVKDDSGIKNDIPPQTGDKGYQCWVVIMVLSMACIIVLARISKATE